MRNAGMSLDIRTHARLRKSNAILQKLPFDQACWAEHLDHDQAMLTEHLQCSVAPARCYLASGGCHCWRLNWDGSRTAEIKLHCDPAHISHHLRPHVHVHFKLSSSKQPSHARRVNALHMSLQGQALTLTAAQLQVLSNVHLLQNFDRGVLICCVGDKRSCG